LKINLELLRIAILFTPFSTSDPQLKRIGNKIPLLRFKMWRRELKIASETFHVESRMLSGVVVFGPRAPFCENRELNADGESESAVLKHRIPNLERQKPAFTKNQETFPCTKHKFCRSNRE
jgi:hypothetical protein